MTILIIGGNGTIGKRITAHLKQKHEVIVAGRTSGDIQVNIEDLESIQKMYEQVGMVDAVVCAAGEARWKSFNDMTEEDMYIGIKSKLMGQVNLVRLGQKYLKPKGSFTLTTGILADYPVDKTTSAAMVNGAIHSFVKACALELENGHRINVVSSGLVADAAEKYADYFPGHNPIPMPQVVNGYVKSILGWNTGEIIRIY